MTKIFKNIWGLWGILMAMMLSAVKPELSHRVLPDLLDLQLIVCDEAPDYSGYATIGSFLEDFTENKTTTLLMCPGILYKTVEALELPETQNMLSISCVDASQTCEWKAAGSHLIVKPRDATVVHVEGVTFTSSTESSVIIEVEPLTPMHVNFIDCVWKENRGTATIDIIAGQLTAGRRLEDASITQVNITGALFELNEATDSIIFNSLANLIVQDSVFRQNTPEKSIIYGKSGTMIISNTTVGDSMVSSGAVFVSAEATLDSSGVCGDNLESGTLQCNGTLSSVLDKEACVGGSKDSCQPGCSQLASCKFKSSATDCYSTWNGLTEAITTSPEGIFEVCAGSTLDVSDPIEVSPVGAMVLKCGSDGTRLSQCVVKGGEQHFLIIGSASELSFQGMTFSDSTSISIQLELDPLSKSDVMFVDCLWTGNDGTSSMVIAPSSASRQRGLTDQKVDSLAIVVISNSSFDDNTAAGHTVSNEVASLVMKGLSFSQNVAGKALIGALGGSTTLDNVQLIGNEIELGSIFVDVDGTLTSTSACGIGNTAGENPCNGTYYQALNGKDPACLDLDLCSSTLDECYSTWEGLSAAAVSIPLSGILQICGGSTLALTESDEPIDIAFDVAIQCGSDGSSKDDCTVKGGKMHFRILDESKTVIFQGLHFREATDISVEVTIDPMFTANVFFWDCHWESNTGRSVLSLVSSQISRRFLQATTPAKIANVTLLLSSFTSNDVSESVLSNTAFDLAVAGTVFTDNIAGESMIEIAVESSTLETLTFVENIANRGVVYVGLGAELKSSGICGTNNTVAGFDCTGILLSSIDSGACLDGNLSACDVGCEAIDECSSVPSGVPTSVDASECYSDWEQLVYALLSSEGGTSFTICSETVFELNEDSLPLVINASDTTIRCGIPGRRDNKCAIIGGSQQLVIIGDSTNARVHGLTFVGTTNATSVFALGNITADATFYDCEFTGHIGIAAIINANPKTFQQGDRRLEEMNVKEMSQRLLQLSTLPESVEPAMEIIVDTCTFSDNIVQIAPLTNLGGNVSVENCQFDGNSGEVGAVVSAFSGNIVVTSSCFTNNTGRLSGSVLVQAGSFLLDEGDNYGFGNKASDDCNGITVADDNTCADFELEECGVKMESSSPSVAPTKGDSSGTVANSTCFSDWETFYFAVKEAKGGEQFNVCQDTTFNLAKYEKDGLVPLVIAADDLVINCSQKEKTCAFSGGSRHVEIRGTVTSIRLNGLVFTDATEFSIYAVVGSSTSLVFENCEWNQNAGEATISVYNPTSTGTSVNPSDGGDVTAPGDDLLVGGRLLQAASDVVCSGCVFEANTASNAIIAVIGADLNLVKVQFLDNEANETIISVIDGQATMMDSCLSANIAGTSIFDGEFIGSGNFAEDNGAADSSGFEFDSDTCVADVKECYDTWENLSRAVSEANTTKIFTLCENTKLEVGIASPISIKVSKTSFRCGLEGRSTSGCLVSGGGIQFQISGEPSDVVFEGITFTESTIASIYAGGERAASVEIVDCLFDSNTGMASILLYNGDLPTSSRGFADSGRRLATIEQFDPPAGRSMSLGLKFCSFQGNSNELAPVAVLGGTLDAESCEFEGNTGLSGGIALWFSGGANLIDSCFTLNDVSHSGGIYADDNCTVTEDNNYSDGNTISGGECEDLFSAGSCESEGVCNGLCVEFTAKTCQAESPPTKVPTVSPSKGDEAKGPATGDLDCLTTTESLVTAIQDEEFENGVEAVFSLCPNTVYEVTDPIVIDRGDVLVKCGAKGLLEDKCTITGGTSHFIVLHPANRLSLRGLTISDSSLVSIQGLASSSAKLTVESCQFEGISGSAAVLVYNQEAGEKYTDQTELGNLKNPSAESMTAEFDSCMFVDNQFASAAVFNIGGSSQFIRTTFSGNLVTEAGVITASSGATVAISSSCFVENESAFPGIVFLSSGAELKLNQNNFGANSKNANECADIFSETSGNCFESGICDGLCTNFEATRCAIPDSDFTYPTSVPSLTPSNTNGQPGSLTPPGVGANTLQKASFTSSPAFIVIVILSMLVVIGGCGGYLFCQKRNADVSPETPANEGEDLMKEDEDEGGGYEDENEDENENEDQAKPKPIGAGRFFGRGGKATPTKNVAGGADSQEDFGFDDVEVEGDEKPESNSEGGGGLFSRLKRPRAENSNPFDDDGDDYAEEAFGDEDKASKDPPKTKISFFNFKKKEKKTVTDMNPLGLDLENPIASTRYNLEASGETDLS